MLRMNVVNQAGESDMDEEMWEAASQCLCLPASIGVDTRIVRFVHCLRIHQSTSVVARAGRKIVWASKVYWQASISPLHLHLDLYMSTLLIKQAVANAYVPRALLVTFGSTPLAFAIAKDGSA